MAKFLVTAEVDNRAEWEESFRTHGELFAGFGFKSPILIGTNENNEVAVLISVEDAQAAMAILSSPENVQAMEADGVKRETVRALILDKEFSF
jgi:hypothetical protein